MDQTLKLKHKELAAALETLEESLALTPDAIARDSTIKRFEYTFELAWKTAKLFLKLRFGVDAFSPKECFRELGKNAELPPEAIETFLAMTDDRNEVIHTYRQKFAEELYRKIRMEYHPALQKIYQAVAK